MGLRKYELPVEELRWQCNPSLNIPECIQRMSFFVLKAQSASFFITSDRLLVIQSSIPGSRKGAGWEKSDALASIVLSPSYLLIMFYYKGPRVYLCKVRPEEALECYHRQFTSGIRQT